MKSRKKLKKQIRKNFDELYQEVFFYETFAINANTDTAKALLDEMLEIESDLIKRISTYDGRYAKGRVKLYFSKLRQDFQKHGIELREKIANLEH